MPPKKSKRENNSKWSATRPKSKLKRRLASDVVKEIPGSRVDVRLVKNDLEASLLYINENMITKIVERANDQMRKVRKKINGDEFLFHCSDANEEEIKCLFGLLYFRGFYHDTKHPTKELWYDTFSATKIYRVAMSLNKYEWLMRTITFHDHNTVRGDFLEDRFACMRWFLIEFEKNAWKCYWYTEYVVINESLRNFYTSHNCDFKVYISRVSRRH